ncbi:RING-type domain-containing protein [Plasmodiophora brassicae]|uniref:RING-type domain-containing protein n=1 Tax=Plasmodiophora brassicae TaxID=37360 RepID=A0A0G4IXL4_PLABS|nr:hypothetical protein PBRA_007520 [Plasmodiophora brassicae]
MPDSDPNARRAPHAGRLLVTMALLTGTGNALVIVAAVDGVRHEVPDENAVMHSYKLAHVVSCGHGLGVDIRLPINLASDDLELLVRFMIDVATVEDAEDWIRSTLGEHPSTDLVRRLLSGAHTLKMHTFMIAIWLFVPLPLAERAPGLAPLWSLRQLRLPTRLTVGPDEVEPLCTICLDESHGHEVTFRTLNRCGHRFHKECIDMWILRREQRRCPNCNVEGGVEPWAEVLSANGTFELPQRVIDLVVYQWMAPPAA